MFGLLKLAVYALVGYAFYEFFVGLTSDQGGQGLSRSGEQSSPQRRQREQSSSNRGEPIMETTTNPDGGRSQHSVGRGVVH